MSVVQLRTRCSAVKIMERDMLISPMTESENDLIWYIRTTEKVTVGTHALSSPLLERYSDLFR